MTTTNQDDVRLLKSTAEVWQEACALLSKRVKTATYEFIKPSELVSLTGEEAVVAVVNNFTEGLLRDPKTLQVLQDCIGQASGVPLSKMTIVTDPSACSKGYSGGIASIAIVEGSSAPPAYGRSNAAQVHQQVKSHLSTKHTFDNFVVGPHNRFVHSAALSVVGTPGTSYNPLFIYGGVGLGKTHIMHAIGNEILRQSPQLSVRYLTCETFVNDFINSIARKESNDFRKRYRKIDVLLVDDIQFLEKKESSQEEFYHTFNTLRDDGKQLVLSSDRPPKSISQIEERLRSRLEWGLVADIQPPDLETRCAILRTKRDSDGMKVNDKALEYIASLYTTNIRELEGALIRTHAYASMAGCELTEDMLRSILSAGAPERQTKSVDIDRIISVVASHYRVEPSEIRSSKRTADLTTPRHIAMYLAHEKIQMSFPRIGQAFNNRKHTSALYAHNKVKESLAVDADLAYTIKKLAAQLDD